MTLQIEHAIREQLILLKRNQTTVEQFVTAIGRMASSAEIKRLASEALTELRRSGELPEELAAQIGAYIRLNAGSAAADAMTVDLHPDSTCPHGPHSDAPAVSLGQVLRERYVLQEKLGAGGKGTVFKALDRYRSTLPEAHQYVALKVLHSCEACAELTMANLRRELHCGQVLSHSNIVKVHELDRDGHLVFFTMELLDGALLSEVIEKLRPAPMRRAHAWRLIQQIGAGLEHAHERGVVHGDLKPRNIWITFAGEVRIFDFGAAHRFVRVTEPQTTRPDFVPLAGTPAYASCEQLEGRPADRRDDLYALACISYELLTAAHPFASRASTVARDFGVAANRPLGISSRQWRTLQKGLSWHRAGRSISVRSWIQRLTRANLEEQRPARLTEFTRGNVDLGQRAVLMRAAAVFLVVTVISAIYVAQSGRKSSTVSVASPVAEAKGVLPTPAAGQLPEAAALAAPTVGESVPTVTQGSLVKAGPLLISVESPQVRSGDRFVEVKVHRNQLQKDGSFTWWTEPATAKQGVDYLPSSASTWNFPSGFWSTRFYVKLLPESTRSQPAFFYIAVAQAGTHSSPGKVIRRQVWLPSSRDQLQARR